MELSKSSKCDDDNDFVTKAGVVNGEWEKLKSKELTSDSFKCLIFVQVGLQIRTQK